MEFDIRGPTTWPVEDQDRRVEVISVVDGDSRNNQTKSKYRCETHRSAYSRVIRTFFPTKKK